MGSKILAKVSKNGHEATGGVLAGAGVAALAAETADNMAKAQTTAKTFFIGVSPKNKGRHLDTYQDIQYCIIFLKKMQH